MSDFKAKMHQIRFPHTALPDPLPVFKGPTSNGEGGERGGKEEGEGVRRAPISCWHRAPRRVNPALPLYEVCI